MKDYFIGEGNKIGYLPTEFGATGNSMVEKKLVASADITKGQVVEITGDLTVGPGTAASTKAVGIAMFDAKAGDPVSIECEGLLRLVASAPIVAGVRLESAALGKVQTKTTGQDIGIALSDGATDGAVYVKFSI